MNVLGKLKKGHLHLAHCYYYFSGFSLSPHLVSPVRQFLRTPQLRALPGHTAGRQLNGHGMPQPANKALDMRLVEDCLSPVREGS